MRITLLSLLLLSFSCATYNARKNIAYSDVTISGGVHDDKQWDEKMEFDRTSWFREATMDFDMMIYKLEKSSQFSNWLGSDKKLLDECKELYVALIYADVNAVYRTAFLREQIENNKATTKIINEFKENLVSHANYEDWRLSQHKVIGICKTEASNADIMISIPGFKTVKL